MKEKIKNVSLFSTLSEVELAGIASLAETRIFPKGALIIGQEEEGNYFFIIAKGLVKVVLLGEDGKETILTTLGKGSFFGEMALFSDMSRSASVFTMEDTELLTISKKDFIKLIQKHPQVSIHLLKELSNRLRRADERIGYITLLDIYQRVIQIILQHAQTNGVYDAKKIVIENRPTNQDIANMIGVSRETVSRVISSLAKAGSLAVSGKKIVIKRTSL